MYWSCFLHFYQPPTQKRYWVDRITKEAYRPIMEKLLANPNARLTINIAAVLLELWEKWGFSDVIAGYRELLERGQIELTGSAKFHPLLPRIPENEVIRQIKLNEGTLKHYFPSLVFPGERFQNEDFGFPNRKSEIGNQRSRLRGFFPPEMAYDRNVARIVASLGYDWVIAEELSYNQELGKVDYSKIYEVDGMNASAASNSKRPDHRLLVFFRERNFSYQILSGQLGTITLFQQALGDRINRSNYLLTAMDGETFGHHRPGMERLLADLFATPGIEMKQISELPELFPSREVTQTYPSTWALMEKDAAKNVPFSRWDDPENEIHKLQWELTDLAIKVVGSSGNGINARYVGGGKSNLSRNTLDATRNEPRNPSTVPNLPRILLDRAIHSDQYWWASARPWWSLEMIERGAKELKDVVLTSPGSSKENKERAQKLYFDILTTGFDWQRSGKVDELARKEDEEVRMRTDEGLPKMPKEELEKIISNLKKEMLEVAAKEEFERAALLRDRIRELRTYVA